MIENIHIENFELLLNDIKIEFDGDDKSYPNPGQKIELNTFLGKIYNYEPNILINDKIYCIFGEIGKNINIWENMRFYQFNLSFILHKSLKKYYNNILYQPPYIIKNNPIWIIKIDYKYYYSGFCA